MSSHRTKLQLLELEREQLIVRAQLDGYEAAMEWAEAHHDDDAFDRSADLALVAETELVAFARYRAALENVA